MSSSTTDPTVGQVTSYRPDIDGLRAFSVLAVLIYHAFPQLLPGGFVGVDIFFVISGYLISLIISRSIERNSFSLVNFYRRRVQRIIPALLVVLMFSLILGWFVLLPEEYEALGKHVAAASTFTSNFVPWSETGYFDEASEYKLLLHLWSLGVEEQFYLIWPLLVVGALRLGIRPVLLLLIFLSFISGVAFVETDAASLFYLPHYRAWELLAGASLVWFGPLTSASTADRKGFTNEVLALVGLALLVVATVKIDQQYFYSVWALVLPVSAAAMLISVGSNTFVGRSVLGNPVAIFIGKISYPLYLWHWPLLAFSRIIESGEPPAYIKILALILSLLFSICTYLFVEKKLRYSKRVSTPIGLLTVLIVLGLAGLTIMQAQGIPSRNQDFQAFVDDSDWAVSFNAACPDALEDASYHCTSKDGPAGIAVIGDSHSINLFHVLAHHYRNDDAGVKGIGRAGCPPLYGTEVEAIGDYECQEAMDAALNYLAESDEVHTVYLASWSVYVRASKTVESSDSKYSIWGARYQEGLEATIDLLMSAGKEVVLVRDWPTMDFNPKACLNIRPVKAFSASKQECSIPVADHTAYQAGYAKIQASILEKYPALSYWDTPEVFCDQDLCLVHQDGKVLYSSHDHLSVSGSRYLGDRFKLER